MKIKTLALCLALGAASFAQAQQINPITRAVLEGYSELLKENPKDYMTLYQRAAQYFSLSMYDDALNDLDRALGCTPDKEKELRIQEFALKADVCIELKEYAKALEAVDNALALDPDSYANLYRKGNICLYLGKPEDAYRSFASMQRLKSRSQEAYFGMAKADIMLGNTSEAEQLLKQAENADPSNYITYCRIGDLYADMNQNQEAAGAYLSAFGLATDSSRPLESLINLASKDFPSVSTAIEYALSKTSNRVPLLFLKGNIAYNSAHYNEAYDGLSRLLDTPEGKEAPIYAQLARTAIALNRLDEAAENADIALLKSNNAANQLVKAEAELARGNAPQALQASTAALKAEPDNKEAMIAVAKAKYAMKDADGAIAMLNDAIMVDAADPMPLMLRAYYYNNAGANPKAAVADYSRVAAMPASNFTETAYKALAKSLNGKKLDGDAIMEQAITPGASANELFTAAIYYAQTGDLQKGKEMRDAAVAKGYSNLYNLNTNTDANLNIAPIRHLK